MKFRVSLKQLFLLGLFASPIWVIVFVALQGQPWGIGALYGQVASFLMVLSMMSMFIFSDRLAAVLYRRRVVQRPRATAHRSVPSATGTTTPVGDSLSGDLMSGDSVAGDSAAGMAQGADIANHTSGQPPTPPVA